MVSNLGLFSKASGDGLRLRAVFEASGDGLCLSSFFVACGHVLRVRAIF